MGALRERMEEDLRLRNLRPSTQDGYLRCVRGFARYHMRSPEEMDSEEVREFLLYLQDERGLSPSTVCVHIAALRFLYGTTLQRPEVMEPFRMPKTPRKLPMVLSGSEVEEFFGAIRSIKYRAILMTTYGAALRISEVCKLRVDDIDSKRMLIRVGEGKGGDERYAMLSARLLVLLRACWREWKPARPYLFPGRPRTRPISANAVRQVIDRVVKGCSFSKRVTPHTLRHYADSLVMPTRPGRCCPSQCLLLHSQVGVEVDLRRLHGLVTEPESDDRAVDTVLEQVHRCRVAKDVGGDPLSLERGARPPRCFDVFGDEAFDRVPAQGAAAHAGDAGSVVRPRSSRSHASMTAAASLRSGVSRSFRPFPSQRT